MNTAHTEIIEHKIVVIERLSPKDICTGKKLYEDAIKHKTSSDISISHEYYSLEDVEEFKTILKQSLI